MKKRMEWARNHMKVNFNLFCSPINDKRSLMDLMGGIEDGTVYDGPRSHRIRRQLGRGGVMFWGVIIGNKLVGPFRVADSENDCQTLYLLY